MRLTELKQAENRVLFERKRYELYRYDREAMVAATKEAPEWIHFGAGNIFRAFPAAVLQELLNQGKVSKGVVVCEGFDYEIIEKAYQPYDNLSLLVVLKADGSISKRVIGSVAESLTADENNAADMQRLEEIFTNSSLKMVSFTITEKGYSIMAQEGGYLPVVQADMAADALWPKHLMGKLTKLLYARYQTGAAPLAMVSMDNCSHNGDKLKAAITAYAREWCSRGLMDADFENYVNDSSKVSFPWSMIDKITPRPDAAVQKMLQTDEFEDNQLIITNRNTYTAPFVNAEETEYLVIEDAFPNGKLPLDQGGIYYTNRETVDKVEKMKVCTCLNPLHTALAIFGCLMSYHTIHEEMEDEALRTLVTRMGYEEGMPVVVHPGILAPEEFIHAVLTKRLPNVFMPDTPQRIATDTSQKLPIRFGETLKAYLSFGKKLDGLTLIPLVLAGYLRYLLGINDEGKPFTPSTDPMLHELQAAMQNISFGTQAADNAFCHILSREDVFGVDLVKEGLAPKITAFFNELNVGPGAIRATLERVVLNK
ncbi:MAG: mannitol dehydrogenase family protein [Lachnospiraceae bacterium]|nr:mannitol dehydrogenase family protein [Lachnospiraceae bacterium]